MSMAELMYDALKKEYEARQAERRKKFDDKTIGVTAITNFCEEKAIMQIKGVKPPVKIEEIGSRLHGTLLHEDFEKLLKKHYPNRAFIIENEFGVKMGDWKIIGHPDVIMDNKVYDFKFIHPFQLKKVFLTGTATPHYKMQVNLYMYLLRKNQIHTEMGYMDYVTKLKDRIKVNNERKEVWEFSIHEIPVPYDERIVKVALNHAKDIIEKVERGEPGLGVRETVEKLKKYYEAVGLDPEELEAEEYHRWMCRYCDYAELCPILQAERKIENEGKEKNMEVNI